jgi:hypothetical protein
MSPKRRGCERLWRVLHRRRRATGGRARSGRRWARAAGNAPASTRDNSATARPAPRRQPRPPTARRQHPHRNPEYSLKQVNSGGEGHRECHSGVPVIALEHEDQDDDEAYQDRSQPRDPTEIHGRILIEVHGVIVAVSADGWVRRFRLALEGVCGGRRITQIPEIPAQRLCWASCPPGRMALFPGDGTVPASAARVNVGNSYHLEGGSK